MNAEAVERESMSYDVVVVGGGPAGLAAAIRFKQLCAAQGKDFSVCVVEKGSEVGAHILSGAVIDPRALQERFELREGRAPQVYGIGLKELWEVPAERHVPGLVVHSAGWPLDSSTYGGSFMYHMEANQVAVGFVVGLAYRNPYLSPFEEFQ